MACLPCRQIVSGPGGPNNGPLDPKAIHRENQALRRSTRYSYPARVRFPGPETEGSSSVPLNPGPARRRGRRGGGNLCLHLGQRALEH